MEKRIGVGNYRWAPFFFSIDCILSANGVLRSG